MKTLSAVIACFTAFLIVSARADLTIVQKVETGGQSGSATVKIKGDVERIEGPDQPTRILDGKKGQMIDLMNDKRAYLKISADQIKAAAETINKFNAANATPPKRTPSG